MDEVKFILKTLVLTVVVLLLMQIKIGHMTIETQVLYWIETSPLTSQLQKVSGGAVLAIRTATQEITNFVAKEFAPSETTRASRLGFEFKRSPQANPSTKKKDKLAED